MPGYDGTGAAERSYPMPVVRAAAERTYPMPEVRAAAERSYLTSKEWWLHGHRRAERSYSTFRVRRGGCVAIPLVQGKAQRLCFAGAAMK